MEKFAQALKILGKRIKDFRGTQDNSCRPFNEMNADLKRQLKIYQDLLTVKNNDLQKSLMDLEEKVDGIQRAFDTKGRTSANYTKKQLTNWEKQKYRNFREEIANLTEGRTGPNYERLKKVFQDQLQLYQDLEINGGVDIGKINYIPLMVSFITILVQSLQSERNQIALDKIAEI